ncbi:MAG: hypothetical protein M3O30_12580 [Planctomycetota bacterium]|nr:hypothetical protein [Planctomycetota bacterium]
MPVLTIISRWLHIVTACLAVGGVFFIRFVQPAGLSMLEPEIRKAVFLKTRRVFKMVMHTAILLFLITGSYNAYVSLGKYALDPAVLHPLLGTHILLALVAFSIALFVLAGAEPPASHRKLMAVNFGILLLVVATASTLKWAREKAVADHSIPISGTR